MDDDGSAKILTNVQTFRDCALHQGNALNIPLMNDFGTSINVHHFYLRSSRSEWTGKVLKVANLGFYLGC